MGEADAYQERHGGQLTIDSALSQGTCVSLDFPHFRADAKPQRAMTAQPRTTELVAG